MAITTRQSVGRPLTHLEMDANLTEVAGIKSDLSGAHPPGGSFNNPTLNQFEASTLMDASMFEYIAEIMRAQGCSGVMVSRGYTEGGTEPYYRPQDVGFSPLNIHNHPNYRDLCGMAEFTAILNGYYVRTRHNDYRTTQRGNAGTSYTTMKDVVLPIVPPSVTAAGLAAGAAGTPANVSAQIAEMQQYFKAFATKNHTVYDYRPYFKWNLAYMEVWLEDLTNGFADPFESDRHSIDAANNRDLIEKQLYFNYGGHKNRSENIPYFANVIRFVDNTGTPKMARVNYRILVKDIGQCVTNGGNDWHPNTILRHNENESTKLRRGTNGVISDTDINAYYALDANATSRKYGSPVTIDTMMAMIPGFDGDGAAQFDEKYQLGVEIDLITAFNTTTPARDSTRYNRFYGLGSPDAVGRGNAKRGFNDTSLWVSRTHDTHVIPVGTDPDGVAFRFTYAIPIELVLRTPLQTWNPYNILPKTDAVLRAENSNPEGSGVKYYTGYNISNFFHITPASFYTGQYEAGDVADTDQTTVNIVSAIDLAGTLVGTQRPPASGATTIGQVRNAGQYIVMPPIVIGADTYNIRMRYPCYPKHADGSVAIAETAALWKAVNAIKTQLANLYTT